MILPPMHNAGQRSLLCQPRKRHRDGQRPKANLLGPLTDTKQRNAVFPNLRVIPQRGHGIATAIVLCHHAEASRAAVHRVGLEIVGEGFHDKRY